MTPPPPENPLVAPFQWHEALPIPRAVYPAQWHEALPIPRAVNPAQWHEALPIPRAVYPAQWHEALPIPRAVYPAHYITLKDLNPDLRSNPTFAPDCIIILASYQITSSNL